MTGCDNKQSQPNNNYTSLMTSTHIHMHRSNSHITLIINILRRTGNQLNWNKSVVLHHQGIPQTNINSQTLIPGNEHYVWEWIVWEQIPSRVPCVIIKPIMSKDWQLWNVFEIIPLILLIDNDNTVQCYVWPLHQTAETATVAGNTELRAHNTVLTNHTSSISHTTEQSQEIGCGLAVIMSDLWIALSKILPQSDVLRRQAH